MLRRNTPCHFMFYQNNYNKLHKNFKFAEKGHNFKKMPDIFLILNSYLELQADDSDLN